MPDALPPRSPLATLPPPFTPPTRTPPERELPLIPLLRAFRTDALRTWPRAAYEERVTSRRLLGRRSVLLNDPAAIRALLVDGDDTRFGRSPATLRILRPLIGRGLFLSEGEDWRHQRRTLAPAFTPRAVASLLPRMRAATAESLDRLAASAAARPTLDLLATCQNLALEIAGRSMFSLGMRRYGGSLRELLYGYGRRGAPGPLDLLLPDGWTTPGDLLRRRMGGRWMALVERMLAARKRGRALPDPDLLDLIEGARDPETGQAFDLVAIRDQMATMMLAGHETTALTLFWAVTLLAQSPAWQDAVAAEAGLPGEDPARLRLTRAVIDEALRLYPPAFAIVRTLREPGEVGGVALAAGDAAVVAPWVLHRHRTLWDAPERFDPRRFLGGAPPDRFAYLPFGAGPRVCIGAHFALTEAVLVLSALVARFRVRLANARPVLPVAVVTTAPDHAPRFVVTER